MRLSKIKLYKVSGISMSPELDPGTYVLVIPVRNYKPGDNIVFERDGRLLIKTVDKITKEKIRIVSHNKNITSIIDDDPYIVMDNVLGKAFKLI